MELSIIWFFRQYMALIFDLHIDFTGIVSEGLQNITVPRVLALFRMLFEAEMQLNQGERFFFSPIRNPFCLSTSGNMENLHTNVSWDLVTCLAFKTDVFLWTQYHQRRGQVISDTEHFSDRLTSTKKNPIKYQLFFKSLPSCVKNSLRSLLQLMSPERSKERIKIFFKDVYSQRYLKKQILNIWNLFKRQLKCMRRKGMQQTSLLDM